MPPEDEGQEVSQEETSPALSSFAQNYLQNVPEDQRPIVQQHLAEWDKGFNKYAQQVQQELGTWKQFGDPQRVSQAMQLADWVGRDPAGFVNWMQEKGYYKPQPSANTANLDDELEDLPPAVRDRLKKVDALDQIQSQLSQIQQGFAGMTRQQQEAAELRYLEQTLDTLKGSMKHYNERGVLGFIAAGMSPQDAAEAWDNQVDTMLRNAGVNPAGAANNGRPAPPVLGQAGSAPMNMGTKRPRELSDNEAKQAAVDMLKAMTGGNA